MLHRIESIKQTTMITRNTLTDRIGSETGHLFEVSPIHLMQTNKCQSEYDWEFRENKFLYVKCIFNDEKQRRFDSITNRCRIHSLGYSRDTVTEFVCCDVK